MPASPVAISTISRTSNVVTVTTSAAHGLIANQGFSISGFTLTDTLFNINSTIVSVTNGTTFTFNQVAANGTATTSGSVLPAKEIVVLSVQTALNNHIGVQYLLWTTTTSPVARLNAVSLWPAASVAENNAIAAGTTVELTRFVNFPNSLTKAQIQVFIAADFTAEQTTLAANTQPGSFFGGFFDGTGWSF